MGTEISHDVRGERGGEEDFFNVDLSRKGYSRGEKSHSFTEKAGGGGRGGEGGSFFNVKLSTKKYARGEKSHTAKDKGGGSGGNLLRRQVLCKLVPVGTEITYG